MALTKPDLPETQKLSFSEILGRLAAQPQVNGIIVMGSGGRGALTPSSDLDICVVLAARPVPIWLALTTVEKRVAEFYFVLAAEFQHLSQKASFSFAAHSRESLLASWLLSGQLWFDRTSELGKLRQRLEEVHPEFQPDSDEHLYNQWFRVNYNLRESGRLLNSTDPIVLNTFDLRLMLYGLSDIWYNYFALRKIRWQGDKEAVRYVSQHDPEFLGLVQNFLSVAERSKRFELYRQLAAVATEPLGGLWSENSTAVQLEANASEWSNEQINQAFDFWEELLNTV